MNRMSQSAKWTDLAFGTAFSYTYAAQAICEGLAKAGNSGWGWVPGFATATYSALCLGALIGLANEEDMMMRLTGSSNGE